MIVLLVLTCLLAGLLLARQVWPEPDGGPVRAGITLLAGLTILAASQLLALLMTGFVPAGVWSSAVAAVLWVWSVRRPLTQEARPPVGRRERLQTLVVVAALMGLILVPAQAFLRLTAVHPHAPGDAMAIWNVKARMLADPHGLPAVVAPGLGISHADYPLLVPAAVAGLSAADGTLDPLWPAVVAAGFALAVCLLLAGGLLALHGPMAALCGAAVLLGTAQFPLQAAAQLADLPVAAFLLAGVVLIARHLDSGRIRPLLWAGACLGAAAATKNEGLVHGVAILGAFLICHGPRRVMPAVASFLPWCVLLWFFHRFTPINDIAARMTMEDLWQRLTDPERHLSVWSGLRIHSRFDPGGFTWPVLAVVTLLLRPAGRVWQFRALVLAMVGCHGAIYLIYVTTPQDLHWHMDTSMTRLLLQVFPATIFTLLVATGRREPARA